MGPNRQNHNRMNQPVIDPADNPRLVPINARRFIQSAESAFRISDEVLFFELALKDILFRPALAKSLARTIQRLQAAIADARERLLLAPTGPERWTLSVGTDPSQPVRLELHRDDQPNGATPGT